MPTPRSLRDPRGRQAILERLAQLSPAHTRRWGKMDVSQMLPHLASSLRLALGEEGLTMNPPGPLKAAIVRLLAVHYVPWPKGKIPAPPGAFSTPSEGWEKDRAIVVELIERFAAAAPESLGKQHPAFGNMKLHDWDVLMYRHIDHHLRQFGA